VCGDPGNQHPVSQGDHAARSSSSGQRDSIQVAVGLGLVGLGFIVAIASGAAFASALDRAVAGAGLVTGIVLGILGNLAVQRVRITRYQAGQEHTISAILRRRSRS
jgi:hypothetical protein